MQMYEGGFISLYRSILNWGWYSDHNTKEVFIHLLLTVNYLPGEWKGKRIEVGQRVTSYQKLADELHLSVKEIRTALRHLQETGEVACESTSQYTVITVKNYSEFQSGARGKAHKMASQTASDGHTKGKPRANEGQQYNKAINNKAINNNKAGGAPTPLRGVALPEIGQGDCCVVYDCERHYYPKEWEAEAEDMDWSIEQLVRWRHHDGVYV